MGILTRLDLITTIFQSIILIVIIAKAIKLTTITRASLLPFFFALAMSSNLLSNFYWIAYDFLKPDTRMPMACNEIGEDASILLLCAGLETILKDKRKIASEIVFATLFIGANIALWIVWSGEWLQDILTGLPNAYFLWLLIRGLISRGCLSHKEMWFMAITGVAALALQIPLLVIKGPVIEHALEFTCTAVMSVLMIWLGVKSYRSKDFIIASTFFLWTELAMFLSSDYYYIWFFAANSIAMIAMSPLVKKELEAND